MVQLAEAEAAAGACAHIARTKDAQIKAADHRATRAESLSRNLQRELARVKQELEEARAAHTGASANLAAKIKNMEVAWKKREEEWDEFNKKRDAQWKADARAWLENAHSKIEEMQAGNATLDRLSKRLIGTDDDFSRAESSPPPAAASRPVPRNRSQSISDEPPTVMSVLESAGYHHA